ncbi:MAG: hypothetical protein Q9226_001781 [Calogaya cf. arnoldii]
MRLKFWRKFVLITASMPDLEFDARLRFLDRSGRLLNQTAPATSAHLMLERKIVAEEHGKPLNKAQMQDVCKACGTILATELPSRLDSVYPDVSRSDGIKRDTTPSNASLRKQSNVECSACRRVAVTPLLQSQQDSRNKQMKTAVSVQLSDKNVSPSSKHGLAIVEKVIPANAGGKKRAKARKQGGLQAMLEKAKGANPQSSDIGLNLMDLIKEV